MIQTLKNQIKPENMNEFFYFIENNLHMSKKSSNFASKIVKNI